MVQTTKAILKTVIVHLLLRNIACSLQDIICSTIIGQLPDLLTMDVQLCSQFFKRIKLPPQS